MTSINLVCPRDHETLHAVATRLVCPQGHRYPVVDGVPVLLVSDAEQTAWWARRAIERAENFAEPPVEHEGIHPYVQAIVAATNGILYQPLVGKLPRYPIPDLRLPDGDGRLFVDLGCNWGRWCIAAARKGYRVIGIDPHLDAILAARQVAKQLGVEATYLVGDARFLPLQSGTVDVVFSYSVLQHFSKQNARAAITETGRVLRSGGECLIQMPNFAGIRCLYHQACRSFHPGKDFDVRYWSLPELRRAFEGVGPVEFSVDGFFGLGIQAADADMLPPAYRAVVRASEWLRSKSERRPWLTYAADSVYVHARRSQS